jgi:hypothetical protein
MTKGMEIDDPSHADMHHKPHYRLTHLTQEDYYDSKLTAHFAARDDLSDCAIAFETA